MSLAAERQRVAEQSIQAMWDGDATAKLLGMTLMDVAPDRVSVAMTISEIHANGHGTCHGGMIFSLAGTAFAMACNSANKATVAQHASITYIRPAQLGDVLLAEAMVKNQTGRSGIYDVVVRNQDGQEVAVFRGCSRQISGVHFDDNREL